MAVVFRSTLLRCLAIDARSAAAPFVAPKRGIYGKAMRECLNRPPRPPPYPYEDKKFYLIQGFWDRPLRHRFDENSKVICVEGPFGVGKTQLAKQLAEELDMKHFPEPTMDMYYINSYGYDMRKIDPDIPPSCRSFDHVNFCKDPRHVNAANFQIMMYMLRYSQYIDALAHLFNSGQGVVLERSPFSDFVFIEAMNDSKFISNGAKSVYYDLKLNTITDLLKPHLVIYLDSPVEAVKEKIKLRNYSHEQGSEVFTDKYLQCFERNYKQNYLKDISTHSELLVYDWTGYGDTEIVVEDIERIDFDQYGYEDAKMQDWFFIKPSIANDMRRLYSNNKTKLMTNFYVPRSDVPELLISADDAHTRDIAWYGAPGMRYKFGYNKEMGDAGILFKTKIKHRKEYE